MPKKIIGNRGSATMEASLLMPVILLLSFLIFVLPIRMYQNAAIYAYAFDTALFYISDRAPLYAQVTNIAGRKVLCVVTSNDREIAVSCIYGNEKKQVRINRLAEGKIVWKKK